MSTRALATVAMLVTCAACSSNSSNTASDSDSPSGAATSSPSASAEPSTDSSATEALDASFAQSNDQSNLAEIALGQIGVAKATAADAKELAAVTLKDHQRLQADLVKANEATKFALPAAPNSMQMSAAAMLMAMPKGAAFDKAFAQVEVEGHMLAIATAKSEAMNGTASSLKDYANGYVPVATMHLEMAQAAATK